MRNIQEELLMAILSCDKMDLEALQKTKADLNDIVLNLKLEDMYPSIENIIEEILYSGVANFQDAWQDFISDPYNEPTMPTFYDSEDEEAFKNSDEYEELYSRISDYEMFRMTSPEEIFSIHVDGKDSIINCPDDYAELCMEFLPKAFHELKVYTGFPVGNETEVH